MMFLVQKVLYIDPFDKYRSFYNGLILMNLYHLQSCFSSLVFAKATIRRHAMAYIKLPISLRRLRSPYNVDLFINHGEVKVEGQTVLFGGYHENDSYFF